ncbi:hypothetical protein [Klebsiella huaxiensis]|uniref:hypothetical protein n=1 Tax=Klebsiella huaxiensis TaxID=2153354 RepID=UPI002F351D5B
MNKFSPENCPGDYLNQNMMGPNVLRLVEELSRSLELCPGMRILDLGCGTGCHQCIWQPNLASKLWQRICGLTLMIMPVASRPLAWRDEETGKQLRFIQMIGHVIK